jgi:molybdate transport system substrate-binding protein
MATCKQRKLGQVMAVMLVLVSILLTASGCSAPATGDTAENSGNDGPLQLFVAAGMKKPMDTVIEKFQAEKGVKVVPNYASSGGLWAQIREDQPCDLYYSADWMYIEMAQEEDRLTEAKEFLSDCLVLVVSDSGDGKVNNMDDLTNSDVTFAIGDPQAPVGMYAETALRNLSLWDKVGDTLKAMPSTVNQVAIMVKEDQVDAGLIYSSVANGNDLKIVQRLDQEVTGEIIFGVGVIKGGNEKLAGEFMDFAFEHVDEFCSYGWEPYE